MNIGEHKITFSQSSKGHWYCSEISIYCNSVLDGIVLIEKAIDEVNKLLEKKNNDPKDKS